MKRIAIALVGVFLAAAPIMAASADARISANRISLNRIAANRISFNGIAANEMQSGQNVLADGSIENVLALELANGETVSN